jgi:hypothetical protein
MGPLTRSRQHLYERHFVIVCRRCHQTLQSDQSLSAHATAEPACPVRLERNYADGFDEKQKVLLKARTKKKDFQNQLEYWKGVYRILFPDVETASIPSPCKNKISPQKPEEQMSDIALVYKDESINYVSYDESCAHTRLHDPHLRAQLLQMVHNSRLVDGILNLINDHQSAVIRPTVLHSDGSSSTGPDPESTLQSQFVQGNELTIVPTYRPIGLGGDPFNYDGSSFFQMAQESRLLQSFPRAMDSGFYSGSSTVTQPDSYLLSLHSADGGYASGHVTSQNPGEAPKAPAPDAATTMMDNALNFQIPSQNRDGIAVDTDLESQFLAWGDEVGHILRSGPEQVQHITDGEL